MCESAHNIATTPGSCSRGSLSTNLYRTNMGRQQPFCDSEFFDIQTVWNTTTPDFPPCFQKTVIQWTPCAFLLIIAPFRLFQLSGRDAKPIQFTALNITKIVLAIVTGAVAVFDLAKAVQEIRYDNTVPMVDFISPLILALTMVLVVFLIHEERKNGAKTSGALLIFWMLLFLAEVIIFQSKIRTALHEEKVLDHFRFTTSFVLLLSVSGEVILTLLMAHNSSTKVQISCPEENAAYLSRLTFGWFTSTVAQGYKIPLEKNDLFGLNPEDSSEKVISHFDKYWEEELEKQKRRNRRQTDIDLYNGGFMQKDVNNDWKNIPQMQTVDTKSQYKANLFTSVLKAYWPDLLLSAAYRTVLIVLQFSAPLALKHLIEFSENQEYLWRGYFYAIMMFIVTGIRSVMETHNGHNNERLGRRAMTAIRSLIYRKMTRLSNTGRRNCTTGEMINLLSVDTCQFADLVSSWNTFWSAPVEIIIALYFMWQTLGPCVLIGSTIMAVLFPLNAYLAKFVKDYQTEKMKLKDSRIKQMNEILNGIKVLKLYAWERSFERQIMDIRDKEFTVVKKISCLHTIISFIWSTVPIMIPLLMFAVYLLTDTDNVLTPGKVFVSLSLFNILRFPMAMLPRALTNLIPTYVSFKRLQRFMNNEELESETVLKCPTAENAISIREGTFTWDRNSKACLRDINLEVTDGSLVAVVGSVGAGKSSLLSALLGEMDKMYGEVKIKGSVAYVAQQAWIQNTSMQKNILFGSQFEQHKYDDVIKGCALQSDLDTLPGGDETEIGEKGINLSGGQKQRVSLARAVYQDADIYLLDDPLSAVDAHVGKHIFQQVVGPNGILKNKTRVLVTHGVSFLSKVDKIVVLVDGQISEVGSFDDLLANNGAFAEFLRTYAAEHTTSSDQQSDSSSEESDDDREKDKSHHSNHKSSTSSNPEPKQQGQTTLIEEETLETGKVKWSVYVTYLNAVGPLTIALYVIICFLQKGVTTSSDVWLSSWSEDKRTGNTRTDADQRNLRLQVYGILVVGFGVTCVALEIMKTFGAMKATKRLHRLLLKNVLKSPMSFFEITPVGRIINRFSKDIDVIDSHIPNLFVSSFRVTVELVFVLAVICMKTPVFVFVLVPLMAAYLTIKKFYVTTSRQIRRIEWICRSPVFSHFSESVAGVSTIRAFGQQQRFIMESQNKVEELNESVFANMVAHRWLAIRLDFLANCTIFLYSVLFAVMKRDTLSAGVIGLSLTYAFDLTHIMNWLVNVSCALETEVVAVERVKEYSENLTEAEWENKDTSPSAQWPDKGAIQFKDFGVRYREGLDLVIKGISCDIQAGEKIGIVGRTGAGKSSLTMALFRIIEKAQGSIVIDGVDISTLGLHDLRSKLTIIPQDPVLFSGSLRMNLDPFNDCTDQQLWKALKQAHLYDFVSGLADGLKHQCMEGGENLSVGQRQLVCLARALFRKTKILVLDEATAAVDLEMDDLIQKTIRKEFCDCTILTIAHRLNTIMDYTRIMVLDSGKICEFDSPKNLLRNTSSVFYGMAKDAGIVS